MLKSNAHNYRKKKNMSSLCSKLVTKPSDTSIYLKELIMGTFLVWQSIKLQLNTVILSSTNDWEIFVFSGKLLVVNASHFVNVF